MRTRCCVAVGAEYPLRRAACHAAVVFVALLFGACSAKSSSGSSSDASAGDTVTDASGADTVADMGAGDSVADASVDTSLPIDARSRAPYEACQSGDRCTNGASCLMASYSSNGAVANLCSIACTRGEACPVSAVGSAYAPSCVVSVSAGTGLCYDTCISNLDCSAGTICAGIPGTAARICVPIGTGSGECGASGAPCCAGNVCASGLTCVAGVCSTAASCGALGHACCASGACNDGLACTGGTCTAGTTASRSPYQRCAPGDACLGSSCLTSIAQVAGEPVGSFCSATCPSGLPSSCPGYVAGAAQQTVACVNFGVASSAQCFRLCNAQSDCAAETTTCTMFSTADGGSIRICVAMGTRM